MQHAARTDRVQDNADDQQVAFAQTLRQAHAEAVAQIEHDRERPGQLTTGINGEVGNSILQAGLRALTEETGEGPFKEPKQFVVAAPPGTGKTSHAIALMVATVRTADVHDLTKPYGCLFVVDQIKKADDIFHQIRALVPGQVAVWTKAHDADDPETAQMWVPPEWRSKVDELELSSALGN